MIFGGDLSRSQPSQALHQRVVRAIAAREVRHAVFTNAGLHKTACLTVRQREVYPDLVLCDRESFRVEHVIEVETPDSLNDQEAQRWALLSRGPWEFWLVVPRSHFYLARTLWQRYGVRGRLATWSNSADAVSVVWPDRAEARPAYGGGYR